jgi:hypothetical protein
MPIPAGGHPDLEGNGFVRALSAEQFNVNLIAVNTRLLNSTLSAGGSLQASARSAVAGRDNVAILGVEYVNSQVKSRTFEEAAGAAQTLEADVADNRTPSEYMRRIAWWRPPAFTVRARASSSPRPLDGTTCGTTSTTGSAARARASSATTASTRGPG